MQITMDGSIVRADGVAIFTLTDRPGERVRIGVQMGDDGTRTYQINGNPGEGDAIVVVSADGATCTTEEG